MRHGRGRPPATRGRRGSSRGHTAARPARSAPQTRVRLAGREVALAALRRTPGAYRTLVEQAKVTDGCGWCLCVAPAPRLVIRHRSGVYYLACWPGGGGEHAERCEFHNDGTAWSGRGHYHDGALDEAADGSATVALSVPLRVRTAAADTPTGAPAPTGPGAARSRMSLLGVLHYLWDRGGLSTWDGTAREDRRPGWAGCSPRVQAATAGVSAAGVELAESCYVIPPFDPAAPDRHQAAFDRFTARLGERDGMVRRGLMLGAVRSWTPTRYGQRCELRHHRTPLYFSTALHARIQRAAPAAMAQPLPAGAEQIVLALVTRSERGNLSAVAAAVMLTNTGFIPADSSHEVVMADALTGAGRSFTKPLRYDADTAVVLPDFVLTDTDPPTVVEVWGMLGREEYAARQQTKIAHYRSEGVPLLDWDTRGPLPDVTRPAAEPASD
ncbi:protein of unknown function DUF1173 (plasmid) [Pseudonocardia dioxanivorans CB1190]|uniref:DUF1173 domain-containing protein n=1 Tax=Pseudonocardia dioxanivorans (strain ATCC 55486 / DSM 44775 / JCM 13855 / CB1190) TaxID=675635 RepID=F2L6I6_PSEUX|nr:protein of unknown function DUF1173 [Pseudonocardia dioxanivorans CB1190]